MLQEIVNQQKSDFQYPRKGKKTEKEKEEKKKKGKQNLDPEPWRSHTAL